MARRLTGEYVLPDKTKPRRLRPTGFFSYSFVMDQKARPPLFLGLIFRDRFCILFLRHGVIARLCREAFFFLHL